MRSEKNTATKPTFLNNKKDHNKTDLRLSGVYDKCLLLFSFFNKPPFCLHRIFFLLIIALNLALTHAW